MYLSFPSPNISAIGPEDPIAAETDRYAGYSVFFLVSFPAIATPRKDVGTLEIRLGLGDSSSALSFLRLRTPLSAACSVRP